MDWMYDGGIKVEKEDYLLGRKVDKKVLDNPEKESFLPTSVCSNNDRFSQVDMNKKIAEDPLVKIKKREIECTQKILQNPVRLKKEQQNDKPFKSAIDDHQLDMILVSRLKSYEKAGLDLAKILSMTKKRKHKKESKKESIKDFTDKNSLQKEKQHRNKYNSCDRDISMHKSIKSNEYSKEDKFRKTTKLVEKNDNYTGRHSHNTSYRNRKSYPERNDHLNFDKNNRSMSSEERLQQSQNKYKKDSKYTRNKRYEDKSNRRDYYKKHNTYDHKNTGDQRSRSKSPNLKHKEKEKRSNNTYKRETRSSSDSNDKKNKKQKSKRNHSTDSNSSDEKQSINKNNYTKSYGLIVLGSPKEKRKSPKKSQVLPKKLNIEEKERSHLKSPAKKKKLTDEEMEQLRKEMMQNAKVRDQERHNNVKRYKKNDEKEEEKQKPYSKEFLIKQLSHAASQVTVERSIKSNVNKLQKGQSIAE